VDVEVLGVVNVLVGTGLDSIDDLSSVQHGLENGRGGCAYSRFQVHQDGAWDVARIVGLVEEDILAVAAFGSKVLEIAVAIDAVFLTQLLPEL
jgi:hypothetical protein